MDQVVDLDSLVICTKVITKRVALFRKVMPMAMENLSITQHRDILRYAQTWGGSYKPNDSYKLSPLDYPYQVCQKTDNADQMLFCNNCNSGYHLFCFKLKFIQVPINIWYCSSCSSPTPWFLLKPYHVFLGSSLGGYMRILISTSSCALYIYLCVCAFFF